MGSSKLNNWTERMIDTYHSSQSQYVFYVKNNAGTGGSKTNLFYIYIYISWISI